MKLLSRPLIALAALYAASLFILHGSGRLAPKPLPLSRTSAVTLSGVIRGIPEEKNGKIRFELDVHVLNGKDTGIKVLVVSRDMSLAAGPGDETGIRGTLSPVKSAPNPGAFDYVRYLENKGISGVLYADSVTILKEHSFDIRSAAYKVRGSVLKTIYEYLPEREAGILAPMIVGEESALSEEQRAEFRNAGVTHILVVSGLNVGYCAVFFLWVFRLAGFSRRKAALLSMPFIVLYVFVTGANPPVIRAGVMALFVILSLSLDREPMIYQSLAIAGGTILLFDPLALFSASFQLSFAATIGIVYLYDRLSAPFKSFSLPLARVSTGIFAVSLGAQAAVLPLLAHYFNRISLAGLISNFFIVPVSGIITALGLILYMAHFISPVIASVVAAASLVSIRLLSLLVHFFAMLPFSTIPVPSPSILFMGAYYAVLWGIFRTRDFPWIKPLLFSLPALLALSMLSGHLAVAKKTEIVFFNLKNGSPVFIDFQGRERWLIDGGGSYTEDFDPGERVLAPFLVSRGINRLDKLVITHPHHSCYAGLGHILENFKVNAAIINPELPRDAKYIDLLDRMKAKGVVICESWEGDSFSAGESTVTVLSPAVLRHESDENSLVLFIESFGKRVLLAGGIGNDAAAGLSAQGKMECDILQVAGRVEQGFLSALLENYSPVYCVTNEKRKSSSRSDDGRSGKYLFTSEKGAVLATLSAKRAAARYYSGAFR